MKRHLFTPGPTPVPPQVLAAMAEPVVHHRSPDYRPVFRRCLDRLTEVFRTAREPLLFTASGTGAMESAVANVTQPGDRIVVVSAGNFGQSAGSRSRARSSATSTSSNTSGARFPPRTTSLRGCASSAARRRCS